MGIDSFRNNSRRNTNVLVQFGSRLELDRFSKRHIAKQKNSNLGIGDVVDKAHT